MITNQDNVRSNDKISANTIILIDENGTKVGEVNKSVALNSADQKGLDLIEITFNKDKNQSVCCLADLNKYLYGRKRKSKENQKIQRENIIDTKEIYLRPNTDTNDIQVKAKKAQSIIDGGDRVKVTLKIKNRENAHRDVAEATLYKFTCNFNEADIEKSKYYEGNNLVIILFKGK